MSLHAYIPIILAVKTSQPQVYYGVCCKKKEALSLERTSFFYLAVWTRLELATPCVTGMYSNQAELPDRLLYQCFKELSFLLNCECKDTPFFHTDKINFSSFFKKTFNWLIFNIDFLNFFSLLHYSPFAKCPIDAPFSLKFAHLE